MTKVSLKKEVVGIIYKFYEKPSSKVSRSLKYDSNLGHVYTEDTNTAIDILLANQLFFPNTVAYMNMDFKYADFSKLKLRIRCI